MSVRGCAILLETRELAQHLVGKYKDIDFLELQYAASESGINAKAKDTEYF